jgi:sugar O-acyltransferase (sialic acid O-acetyltransferase NeuD family)
VTENLMAAGTGAGRTPLIVIGAGGFSRETAETVRVCVAAGEPWELLGFVDDNPSRAGTLVDDIPVLGKVECVLSHPEARFVVGTGRPDNYASRKQIVTRLGLTNDRYASVVHPHASLALSTTLGNGVVVLAGSVTTSSVRIGNHVAIMPGVVLTHDDVIDDFVTIASGVRLGGAVQVGTGAYLGAGVLVRENLSIGAWSMIGMGSIVTRDVPPGQLWLGSPARYHRAAPVPAELLERQEAT